MNSTPPTMTARLFAYARHPFIIVVAVLIGAIGTLSADAGAVSSNVRNACMSDYFSYCSQHDPDGPATRRCMSVNGAKLSTACVNALVAAGEISRKEVQRREARANGSSTRRVAAKSRNKSACATGPARPGARSTTSCRATVARGKGPRQLIATAR